MNEKGIIVFGESGNNTKIKDANSLQDITNLTSLNLFS